MSNGNLSTWQWPRNIPGMLIGWSDDGKHLVNREGIPTGALATEFETRTLAEAYVPFVAPAFICTTWFDTDRAPGSGATYRLKGGAEPATPGDFSLTTLLGQTKTYAIADKVVSPTMFGAKGNNALTGPAVINNDTAAFQAAFDLGRPINVPLTTGAYVIGSITGTKPVQIFSEGAVIRMGTGLVAGGTAILMRRKITCRGINFVADVRVNAFKVEPNTEDIVGVWFDGNTFKDFFYSIRCGLPSTDPAPAYFVKDAVVSGNYSEAPVGINAGHILMTHCRDVNVYGNHVVGGYNTSVYGFADCIGITVTGNTERGVVDTAGAAEAACQLEDCVGSKASITGNSFDHDIWISGSSDAVVSGNRCRRLRVSIGNVGGHDSTNIKFSDNVASNIVVSKFGSATVPERIRNVDFVDNTLDPASYIYLGSPIGSLVFMTGADIDGEIVFRGNRAISNANTNALIIARSATASYVFEHNDWGSGVHSLSGSGGRVYERNCRNPFTKSGYVQRNLTADITSPVLGAWTKLQLNAGAADINSEWDAANFRFQPKRAGYYEFGGIFCVTANAAGDQAGLALYNSTGGTEIRRLGFGKAAASGAHVLALSAYTTYLEFSDIVEFRYFITGSGSQILSNATLTSFFIRRVG